MKRLVVLLLACLLSLPAAMAEGAVLQTDEVTGELFEAPAEEVELLLGNEAADELELPLGDEGALPAGATEVVLDDAVNGVAIDAVHFPDGVFREKVKSVFDTDRDGALSEHEISVAREMTLWDDNCASLKGIEYFTALETLNVGAPLTDLDLASNRVLRNLYCSKLKVTGLELTANSKLERIECSAQSLKSLKLGTHNQLNRLICMDNQLTSLDISGCPILVDLVKQVEPVYLEEYKSYAIPGGKHPLG